MKFYLAGAWTEQHSRARPMIAKLEEAGLTCTCNWTQAEGDVCSCRHHRQEHQPFASDTPYRKHPYQLSDASVGCTKCASCMAFNGIGSGGDSLLTDADRIKYAQADLDGVLQADIVWLLAANDKGACGSWVELGAALALHALVPPGLGVAGPIVVVSGPKNKRTIFTELADKLFETDEEALVYIVELNRGSL